jgi:TPR repeat protein
MFWLLMAANQGHFEAQRLVAIIYQNGEVVPKDPEKAAYWFRKAEGQNK